MKNPLIVLLSLMILLSLPLSSAAQQYAHAGEYMGAIGEMYEDLAKDQWTYIKASSHSRSARRIERKRQDLLQTNRAMQRSLSRMPAFEGDASLRDSTVQYLRMCYDVLNEDYGKIVDLEAIAEESYDAMEAYLAAKEKASNRLDEAGDRLQAHQKVFAASHNVQLLESEKSRTALRLEQAGQTINYYNRIYLIFFKSYKQEAYLMEAAQAGDLSALVQNQQALLEFAEQGLASLDTLPDFEGDASLKQTCRQLLLFYQQEAQEAVPVMADFFLKKETFEKVKTAVEAMRPQDRTEEDVNRYNAAVDEFNAAVAAYNQVNEQLSARRSTLVKDWNKTTEKFMDQHVPR